MLAPAASGREMLIPAEDGRLLAATLVRAALPRRRPRGAHHRRRRHRHCPALLRPVCRLSRRARAHRADLRLPRHRRLALGLAQGLQGAHARLVPPRLCRACSAGWRASIRGGRSIGSATASGGFATGLAHNNHLIARQLCHRRAQRLLAQHGAVGALAGARSDGRLRAAGGGHVRLSPRPAAGRRGPARPRVPGVAALVHDARFPVRRRDPAREGQLRGLPRARALRPDRGRRTGRPRPPSPRWRAAIRARRSVPPGRSASPTRAPPRIGHHGFFRAEFRDTLWAPAADWLEA